MADINHGTAAGYTAHRRNGEDACEPCKQAEASRSAKRKSDPEARMVAEMLARRADARTQISAINRRDAAGVADVGG